MTYRRPAVVALGMFDGVHLGHQELIKTASAFAKEQNAACCVYTFLNHPSAMLGRSVKLLTTPEERYVQLLRYGAEEVRMEPFDGYMMHMSPEGFIEHLRTIWDLRGVVTGFNYTFGARGAGTSETMRRFGQQYGFSVHVVPSVQLRGATVSSTRIRGVLEDGDVHIVRRLLGRPYSLAGTVVPNRQNGRKLGFPTANLNPSPERALPKHGVYITEAVCEDGTFRGITNVGTNPTLHGDHISVETHLLDYEGELYGKHLEIRFLVRLRGERAFPSLDALRAQIASDTDKARLYRED